MIAVTRKRKIILESLTENFTHTHMVRRSNIFEDVLTLYRKESASILAETPFQLEYEGERAMDTGGVMRDVFSTFWEAAIPKLFNGSSAVIPAVTPYSEIVVFCAIGTILSHGFIEAGFFPVRVAFPVIACVLKGLLTRIPDGVVLRSFFDYLSTYEADRVQ